MRYDEAHTFVRYASRPFPLIFVEYDEPNNHILHSACVAIATRLAGDSPAAIRCTALLAGMLIPVAVYLLTVAWYRRSVAGLAGLLTSVMPVLVFYSVNARGYTLTCVLILVAAASAGRAVQRCSSFAWCCSIVSLSLAMWTIPTMVYGAAAVFGTLAMHSLLAESWFAAFKKVAIAGVCVSMLTIAFYMPIVLAYGPDHLSQLGSGAETESFFAMSLPADLWSQISVWASQGLPGWLGVGLCGTAIVGGLTLGCISRQRSLVVAPAVIIVVILLQGVLPQARTWCFAVPFVCVLAVVGIDAVTRATSFVRVRYGEAVLTCVILIAVVMIGVQSHRNRYVLSSEETGFFPEGNSVAEYLAHELVGHEPVISVTPASAVLVYYARKHQLSESHFMIPGLGYTDDSAALLVVDRRSGQMPVEVLAELGLGDLFPPENAVLATSIEKADIYRIRASAL
jgi:hypothetical protein